MINKKKRGNINKQNHHYARCGVQSNNCINFMSTGNLLLLFMSQQMDIAGVMELQPFFCNENQMLTEYMPLLNTPSSTVMATKI